MGIWYTVQNILLKTSTNEKKTRISQMRKLGRNIYSQGGNMEQLYSYLFDGDDEDAPATAPDETELPVKYQQTLQDDSEYQSVLQMAMSIFSDDPFTTQKRYQTVPHGLESTRSSSVQEDIQPYNGQVLSSGKYGSTHIGEFGKKIYGELATDLGYAPIANSIYRDPNQQAAFVKQGIGARNSYHLTGNAVDIKPADWQKLSQNQQAKYRSKYDVLFHNHHYHLEPK